MKVTGYKSLIASVIVALLVILIGAGCEITPKQKADAEYRAEDLAFYDDDKYIERYLLYEDAGEYERYIGGRYKRVKYDGPHWGTLYETGSYKKIVDKDGETEVITFRPKKRYDVNAKDLKPMPANVIELETRKGTITEQTLEIEYFDEDYIWISILSSPYFTRIYKRQ